MALLDMTPEESKELYEFIQVLLGGQDIDVDITEAEIKVLARRALKDYLFEIAQWQMRNQYANVVGTNASVDFTNKFIMDNPMIAQRISDWFASMQRVGGKIPWKKDFIVLESGRQVYDLSVESSTPYIAGTRRIHKIMWYGPPEVFSSTLLVGDFADPSLFSFGQAGLAFGGSPLMYLGNLMDVVLMAQALETRSKVLRSEFFYNISGDIVELTPQPGNQSSLGYITGSRVYYYYFDESDPAFLGLANQDETRVLISNPTQIKITNIPYSGLNDMSKSWVDNYTLALAKYVQAAKWRKVRKIASPSSEYEIEFDYSSLIDESKQQQEDLKTKLNEQLLLYLDSTKMMTDKLEQIQAAAKINQYSPRKFFLGTFTIPLILTYLIPYATQMAYIT